MDSTSSWTARKGGGGGDTNARPIRQEAPL